MFKGDYDIKHGDCLEVLKTLPDECVDMCVTSPPYLGLRKYSNDAREIGREDTPDEYVAKLRDAFYEVKRVLKPTGTLWLNLGDTYDSNKDMLGLPWQVAFALKKDGWILRNDIIFAKTNPMPSSVEDRCTSSHEYIFMFSKIPKGYYFDYEAIEEESIDYLRRNKEDSTTAMLFQEEELGVRGEALKPSMPRFGGNKYGDSAEADGTYSGRRWEPKYKVINHGDIGRSDMTMHLRRVEGKQDLLYPVRRKRDVWNIATHGYAGAHFATFPEKLVEPCILAGCPKNGIVLDCFNGAGTTGVVALKNHRRYLGIELNEEYIKLSRERIERETAQQTLDF